MVNKIITQTISLECSTFLRESYGLPVFKNLPSSYDPIKKVKVRHHKPSSEVIDKIFNNSFCETISNIRQRAIFVKSSQPKNLSHKTESYYVFPVDGYDFLYCKNVHDSFVEYKQVFETVSSLIDENNAEQIITDLIEFNYKSLSLKEGITSNSEIIFFKIPYYYAVRVSSFPSYSALLQMINT